MLDASYRRNNHKLIGAAGAVALVVAAVLGTAPAAQALPVTKTVTVMAKTQRQVHPNLNTKELKGWHAKGARVTLTCYTYGQAVKGWGSPGIRGGWDSLWYKTGDGTYSADVDLATGTNGPAVAKKCAPPPPAKQTTTSMSNFVKKVKGKTVANALGTHPGECVSLVSQYLLQVRGLKTGAWGNAVDYQFGGSGGKRMKAAGWTWRTDKKFRDGDVLVWRQSPGWVGANGHVAVWYSGRLLQQNWAGNRHVSQEQFFSAGYRGYWRR